MKESQLIFHTTHDFRGRLEQITCEWEGPKDGIVSVNAPLFERHYGQTYKGSIPPAIGEVVSIGPFSLRVFEHEPWQDAFSLVRTDSFLGQIKVAVYHLTRWLDLLYRRLIITTCVWKLAEYNQSSIPSWKDLHIVQRLGK